MLAFAEKVVSGLDQLDCIVIGAGVVGLAIARALGQAGLETIVVERNAAIGEETSSRNSEVIHAGIYYPAGSRKALSCVAGRDMLYAYCDSHNVPHRRCGKLIVASSDAQVEKLDAIEEKARANGVDDLERLSKVQALDMEPALNVVAALHSPSTGVIDSHAYMLSLLGEAEDAGVMVAFGVGVKSIQPTGEGCAITLEGDDAPSVRARIIVNAAGLGAVKLAHAIEGFPRERIPHAYLAKGSYFTLSGKSPFSRLIYPVPEQGGLGVHLTLDLGGQARFGPDVEWVETPNLDVDPARGARFYDAIRRYWPELKDGVLAPGYAGLRPKIAGPGEPDADFVISGPDSHGVPGLINLFGIESPGLTASLALADEVAALALSAG